MNQHINRRSALRLGLFGLAAGGVASTVGPKAFGATSFAGVGSQKDIKKLLLIFLRGGNDGVNTVIPAGDPDYAKARTNISGVSAAEEIGIADTDSLMLTSFARLHPALTAIEPFFTAGDMAFVHRVGNPFPSFSHFTSQQYWETGFPGKVIDIPSAPSLLLEDGFVTKAFAHASMLAGGSLPGASVSKDLMRLFASSIPSEVLAHIPRLDGLSLTQGGLSGTALDKLTDALDGPTPADGAFGNPQGGLNAALLGTTGKLAFGADAQVAVAQGYTPQMGVNYPMRLDPSPSGFPLPNSPAVDAFGQQLKDAMALLKLTDARIVGVELGGFDTHSKQGGVTGQHADQLRTLAAGMEAVYDDIQLDPMAPDLVTLTMSEFGRTSIMNGSAGTDHGTSSVMMAMGSSINGGVYNCSPGTGVNDWNVGVAGPGDPTGSLVSDSGKYLKMVTDYRAVLAEVLDKHLDVSRMTSFGTPSEMHSVLNLYDTVKSVATSQVNNISMDDVGILP